MDSDAINGGDGTTEPPRVSSLEAATKLQQTVTSEGERVDRLIDGVRIRSATTQPDERGTVCEVYNPAWGLSDEPLPTDNRRQHRERQAR